MTQVLIDRATLEQLVGALEAVLDDHEDLASCEARHELRTALAQHREQQPVCHGCGIPAGDVHMSTCKSGKWPSRVSNGDTAALAQQDDSLQAKYLKSELAHILAQQELPQKERPDFMAGYDAGMADAKRMAQQGEQPTQRQLDTAMRQWETWKAYALELQAKVVKYEGGSPMLLNAAAPAQQWEPVAWYEYNQDLDAWFLAYGHNPKAKTRPLVFGDTAAPAPQAQQGEPVCAGCGIPAGDVHMSTCKSGKWPSRVSNGDTAAPAPAPAPQDWKKEPEYVPPLVKWAQEQPAPKGGPVMFAWKRVDGTYYDASGTEHSCGMYPLFAHAERAKAAEKAREE